MYGVAGERWLPEREALGSAGMRTRNRCASATPPSTNQLDVFGEVMDAVHHARVGGLQDFEAEWEFQLALLEHLEAEWRARTKVFGR